MTDSQPNNPLHGITLENLLKDMVEYYGWEGLSDRINLRCFKYDPTVKSSLKVLRKEAWAREKLEDLYIATQHNR